MIQAALTVAMLSLAAVPRAPDTARTLSPDELELYTVTIRDPLRLLAPVPPASKTSVSLDPYIRPELSPPRGNQPLSGTRLAPQSLNALTRATRIFQICEPAPDSSCRGQIRGMVLRLPEVRVLAPDSAQVVLLVTTARAEFDNTVVVPFARYYAYDLSREGGRWSIRHARRGLPSWRTP